MQRKCLVLAVLCVLITFSGCAPLEDQINELVDNISSDSVSDPEVMEESTPSQRVEGIIDGFGMGSSTHIRVEINNLSAAYAEMKKMGVQFIREEFPMADMQSGMDRFDFSPRSVWDFDQMVALANQYDLEIVALLCYGPDEPYSSDEEFFSLWANYVETIVRRYGDDIDFWEIGNEMNIWNFWGRVRHNARYPEVDIYAEMLEISYEIIKDIDPDDTVIMGGLVNTDSSIDDIDPLSFVYQVSEYSDGRYYDAVALHTYWRSNMPEASQNTVWMSEMIEISLIDYVSQFARGVQELNNEPIPIWLTEIGYDDNQCADLSVMYNIPPENIQAIALARVYTALLSIPNVEAVFWYTYENDPTGQTYALKAISKEVYQVMAEALLGTTAAGKFFILNSSGNPVEHYFDYRFMKPTGETVSIFWKDDPDSGPVDATINDLINSPAQLYELYDGFDGSGSPVEDAITEIPMFEAPGIIVGEMKKKTVLILKDETADSRQEQIIYQMGAEAWRYGIASQEFNKIPITVADNETPFFWQNFINVSSDGKYLAYSTNFGTEILNLVNGSTHRLDPHVSFLNWANFEDSFYAYIMDNECPPVDRLEEQELITVEVYLMTVDDQIDRMLIGLIEGGLKLPEEISNNGQWLSIRFCGCYSECGSVSIVHLTNSKFAPLPFDEPLVGGTFSPDSEYFTFYRDIWWGSPPSESPLYVSSKSFSDPKEVYYEPNVIPGDIGWSQNAEWISFTAITVEGCTSIMCEENYAYEEVNHQAVILSLDGQIQFNMGDDTYAVTWAPDSDQFLYRSGEGSTSTYYIYDIDEGTSELIPISGSDISNIYWVPIQ